MGADIDITSPLFFTGFESILEGLFGPGLVKDITLFQGKHAQTHMQSQTEQPQSKYKCHFFPYFVDF